MEQSEIRLTISRRFKCRFGPDLPKRSSLPRALVGYGDDFTVNATNHIPSLTGWSTLSGVQYRLVYSDDLARASGIL